jgi:hypothetical protein
MEEARGEAGGEAEQQHGDDDYQQHNINRAAAPPTGVEQDTGVVAMERRVELTSEIGGGGAHGCCVSGSSERRFQR